jgi:hypothetical protein
MYTGRFRIWVFIILVLCGVFYTQTASLCPGHQHHTLPAHSCAVCQAGHLPLLQPPDSFHVSPPILLEWRAYTPNLLEAPEPLIAYTPSRAPPA